MSKILFYDITSSQEIMKREEGEEERGRTLSTYVVENYDEESGNLLHNSKNNFPGIRM